MIGDMAAPCAASPSPKCASTAAPLPLVPCGRRSAGLCNPTVHSKLIDSPSLAPSIPIDKRGSVMSAFTSSIGEAECSKVAPAAWPSKHVLIERSLNYKRFVMIIFAFTIEPQVKVIFVCDLLLCVCSIPSSERRQPKCKPTKEMWGPMPCISRRLCR